MMNGNLDFTYTVYASLHSECGDTPCVESFPNDIITVHPDGIVVMVTIGVACEAFTWECPHDAIRIHVNTNITKKCNFYHHLVDQGLVPACADNTCLTHFIYFGEADVVR